MIVTSFSYQHVTGVTDFARERDWVDTWCRSRWSSNNHCLEARIPAWSTITTKPFLFLSGIGISTCFNADASVACNSYQYSKLRRRWWEIEPNQTNFHKDGARPHAGSSTARLHDQKVATQWGFGHRYRSQPLLLSWQYGDLSTVRTNMNRS